ncbi:amidohydrolase [Chitinophaga silvisoli]|uniref:Amidohydrolase n=1 Tax=Chitinophaga silvisoli TaxID=2291814 RepID=A0A3E1NN66_9BACT|nr:amidohydrolase [Chitinophaga silvisoli]RFM29389.1 amidohydrolase [Chitinophaga silvisoli]
MEHHHHSCTHCACDNPILKLLKDELFTPENFATLPKESLVTVQEQSPPFMVSGGTIRPMINGSVETVQAIGFAEGKVVATGTIAEVSSYMQQHYPGYNSRELPEDNTLLPGLIEPHLHLVPTAMLMGWTDLGGFDEQMLRKQYDILTVGTTIRKAIVKLQPNEWFLGSGLDPALMPLLIGDTEMSGNKELITIDINVLDEISTVRPIMIISASMHTLYVNSPALLLIWENEANQKALSNYSSYEDYKTQTKGQLQEAKGMDPALKTLPFVQKAAMFLDAFVNLKTIFETANSRGVTYVYDAGMDHTQQLMLKAYLAVNKSTVRIGAAQVCNKVEDAAKLPIHEVSTNYEDIHVSHVKVISDGSNQGLTGYQSQEYLCNPAGNFGVYNFGGDINTRPETPPADFMALMKTIIKDKKWPVMIHANGDLAVQFAIEAFKECIPDPFQGVRHRIEHCSLTTQQNLDDMKQMQVSPSFLIGHVGYWGYAFKEAIFGGKSGMLDLCNSALQRQMRITLHSDNSVSPMGPLRMMEQSITRRMEADPEWNVLNAQECITHEQALKAITYDAAWQCYAEQWTGSLKVGNFADFVVLQQDPLKMKNPYMHMRNIGVLETWVAGKLVYGSTVSETVSMG